MENAQIIDLVKKVAKERNEIAFSEIFDFIAPKINAYFIKNNLIIEQAEELTQEVLSTIWLKAGLFNPEKSKFITWSFTIARNKKIDFYRKNKKNEIGEEDIRDFLYDNTNNTLNVVDTSFPQKPYGCILVGNKLQFNTQGYGTCSETYQCLCTSSYGNGKTSLILDDSTSYGMPYVYGFSKANMTASKNKVELDTKGGNSIILLGGNFGPAMANNVTHISPVQSIYCSVEDSTSGNCAEACKYQALSCTVLSHFKMV